MKILEKQSRRAFLKASGSALICAVFSNILTISKAIAEEIVSKISKTDDEWKKQLSDQQYDILRHEGTERAFTSELLNEHREGVFVCAACDLPLFAASAKFDSGTGWPSFFAAMPNHLETRTDYKLLYPRTEYHCARCGGHHGHLFDDGPKPTGLRYCNNGAVLKFKPKQEG